MRTLKKMPRINNEDQERVFWSRNDSTEYLDYSKASKAFFPNLKPSTKTISVRLPEGLLVRLKLAANKRDIPYQSLLKIYLSEMLERESANTNRAVSVVRKPASKVRRKG
jgi:predicted DNA binding CopG/RHH family protein